MKTIWTSLATVLGIGFFPVAPGTVCSAATTLLYYCCLHKLPWLLYLLLILFIFILGSLASTAYAAELQQKDPRKIVVDEACGQLIALFLVPPAWLNILIAFLFFRLFDITKPFPIKKVERLPKGWGIMADDLMAAVYAAVIIHVYLWLK